MGRRKINDCERGSEAPQVLYSPLSYGDNLHYEKFADGSVKCIEDEIPFELPDGWAWSRLGAVAEAIGDGDHQPPPQTSFGVPFLVISNVSGGRLSFENTRFVSKEYFSQLPETRKPRNGDLLFTVTGSYLAATGARVSELIQIKIEHVELGYFDLYTKGGKLRRLYVPKKLRTETLEWLEETHRSSGYLFLNRYGERITTRGISQQLKNYADKYGLDKKVVYPHSFRHRYAKNFLEKYNDIALLADLMGHESIETTRIYLRRTASEQRALVDKIVTW